MEPLYKLIIILLFGGSGLACLFLPFMVGPIGFVAYPGTVAGLLTAWAAADA